ncbi:MAG: ribosome maturation factor RimP [candidate division WOR-3 bacterium]|nr:ribosome maturation factor RimP [candidate division WOR-3 bacterium]MCX7757559.1 ribosome maturation factor RimP [candidate division WOR-3 bacterium]MDW7987113.1 ribosome maturation factor RimP [candidate division WOR-3 bacterium]
MSNNQLTPELKALINKTVTACGVEVYDLEFKGRTLRVFITCEEGVTVETCARVSEALSEELDKANLIFGRYFLEVSSPGIERRLRHQRDFEEVIGKIISVHTKTSNYVGKLQEVSPDGIIIETASPNKEAISKSINYEDIVFAQLKVSTDELFSSDKKQKGMGSKENIEEA